MALGAKDPSLGTVLILGPGHRAMCRVASACHRCIWPGRGYLEQPEELPGSCGVGILDFLGHKILEIARTS